MADYTKREFSNSMESMKDWSNSPGFINPHMKGIGCKAPTATGIISELETHTYAMKRTDIEDKFLMEAMADRWMEYFHKVFDYTIDDKKAFRLEDEMELKWPNYKIPYYNYRIPNIFNITDPCRFIYQNKKEERKKLMDKIDKIISKLIEKKILGDDLTISKYLELKKELFAVLEED